MTRNFSGMVFGEGRNEVVCVWACGDASFVGAPEAPHMIGWDDLRYGEPGM